MSVDLLGHRFDFLVGVGAPFAVQLRTATDLSAAAVVAVIVDRFTGAVLQTMSATKSVDVTTHVVDVALTGAQSAALGESMSRWYVTVAGVPWLAGAAEVSDLATARGRPLVEGPLTFAADNAAVVTVTVVGGTGPAGAVTSVASRTGAVVLARADVGLGNVDNTTDVAKPVSTAQATALALKADLASPTFTGVPAGPTAAATTNTTQLATTAFVTAAVVAGGVTSVASRTGAVVLTSADVGLGSVDNTTDASKPVSTAQNTAIALKANLASPTFTGVPAAPTAAATTNTTQLATTAFVTAAVAGGVTSVASRTGAVVLARADVGLGNVDNTTDVAKPVSTAQATALALKADLASPTFTGVPAAPTAAATTNTTQLATTAFVTAAVVAGAPRTINAQTGTAYTLVLTDAGRVITASNAAAVTVTVPPNSAVAFPIGTVLDVVGIGVGIVTIVQGAGVVVNATPSRVFRAQHSAASLLKVGTDTWQMFGDLA